MLISLFSDIGLWLGLGLIGNPGRKFILLDSLRGKCTHLQIRFSGDSNFDYYLTARHSLREFMTERRRKVLYLNHIPKSILINIISEFF